MIFFFFLKLFQDFGAPFRVHKLRLRPRFPPCVVHLFFKWSRALEWCQGRYQQKELEEEEEEDLDGVFHNTRKLLLSVVVETIK